MRSCRAAHLSVDHGGILSALNLTLAARCQGNAKSANYSFCEVDIRGDKEEQLMWVLCKPSQDSQGVGPRPVLSSRFPNFMTVETPFSPFTMKLCFAEPLDDAEKVLNAEKLRDTAAADAGKRLKLFREEIEKLKGLNASPSEVSTLVERCNEFERSVNAQVAKAKLLRSEELKAAYKAVEYDVDAASIIRQLTVFLDRARAALGQRVQELSQGSMDADLRAYLGETVVAEEDTSKQSVDSWLKATWRVDDLVRLGLVKRKVDDSSVYVRYDQQGRAILAYRDIPQFDIYRPWKVLYALNDVKLDSTSQMTLDAFNKLRQDFDRKQKTLKPTLAYAVSKLTARTLNEILNTQSKEAPIDMSKLATEIKFVQKSPTHEFQRYTASLILQEDACKDVSTEVVSKNADEERHKEAKAKREDDSGKKAQEDLE